MRRLALPLALLVLLLVPSLASAAVVAVGDGALRVADVAGEENRLSVSLADDGRSAWVSDEGAALTAGPGCVALEWGPVQCPLAGVREVAVSAGPGDDEVFASLPLPARLSGDAGDDRLSGGDGADSLAGGPGADELTGHGGDDLLAGNGEGDRGDGGPGRDRLAGGAGDDALHGGEDDDRLRGNAGRDTLDGGAGDDVFYARENAADTVWCGLGADRADADARDWLDPCESVDYGPAGLVGRIFTQAGGGRFVPIPGQPGETIDRRLLPGVLYLVRRYKVRITDGYSASRVHTSRGEHPLGLAVDIVPGPGGSWNKVDKLAKWAEPRQNHPRWPFRWVGYNGDYNHGRGHHLHLSWAHGPSRPYRPVWQVWLFSVKRGAKAARLASTAPPVARRVAPAVPQR